MITHPHPTRHAMNIPTEPLANAAQNVYSTLDTAILSTVTLGTSLITWALAVISPWGMQEELKLLLLPLIGSLIASGGMILLNPKIETRRIVIGRAMFSLLFGCATPQIVSLIISNLSELFGWADKFEGLISFIAHPVILLCGGAFASMVLYAISKPWCSGLYAKAEDLSESMQDKLFDQFGKHPKDEKPEE